MKKLLNAALVAAMCVTILFCVSIVASADSTQNGGMYCFSGKWYYMTNGDVDTSVTGLVQGTDGVWYYMKNGRQDLTATGLVPRVDGQGWYYVQNGVFKGATGLVKRVDGKSGWFFVKNGVYTQISGITQKADKSSSTWFYVNKGVYSQSATGIAKIAGNSASKWYYVQNGIYKTTTATGIARRADGQGGWYYVKNGIYNTGYTGIVRKVGQSTGWYYIKNGVYTQISGIAQKADKSSNTWYYVKKGVYSSATGITKIAGNSSSKWYFVKNGIYNTKACGIAKKADGSSSTWFYVFGGVYRTNVSGIAKKADGSSNTWYYVKNGIYNTGFTGLSKKADGSSTTYFYVKKGVFTKSTLMLNYNGKYRYVKAGVWQSNFSGEVTINGTKYVIYKGNKVFVRLDVDTLDVVVGKTHHLEAEYYAPGGVTWSSSNSSILQVYSDGSFVGLKEGTATVYASITVNGKTYRASCSVDVNPYYAFYSASNMYDQIYYSYDGYSNDFYEIIDNLSETVILSASYGQNGNVTVNCKCLYNAEYDGCTEIKYIVYDDDYNIYDYGTIYDYPIAGQIWSDTIYLWDLPYGEYTIEFGNCGIGYGYDLY